MFPRTLSACCAIAFAAAAIHAQTNSASASVRMPAIPATPAGAAFRSWLAVYNSGDSTAFATYMRTHRTDPIVSDAFHFRPRTGGIDLLTIERSESRHLEFTFRARRDSMVGYGAFDLMAGDTGGADRIGLALTPIGPNASVSALGIDAATRRRVVDRAISLLDSFYVFPGVATRMGDSLRARLARGVYDADVNGPQFALQLDRDLRGIGHDKHLSVRYSGPVVPPPPPGNSTRQAPSPDDVARERRDMEAANCGFVKAEQLDGNIGYLKFNMFADTLFCAQTAAAAMTFLAGTRALVIDLRENGGGSPDMVDFIASYVIDHRTHINDLWIRYMNRTHEFWTLDHVPGRRFGGIKPVYVLTSAHTFSGAEELTYDLQALKRATIVGETTGGGAHPVLPHRIDDHFMIGVPFARAINPTTHTNWEGVGVAPDIKVPAATALDTALARIRSSTPH